MTAAGKLIIVPTPIGNLGDMTLRSLEALRAADVVCAEGTRVTGKLLAHFDMDAHAATRNITAKRSAAARKEGRASQDREDGGAEVGLPTLFLKKDVSL